jgi:linoleoyl-CoA desaturase
VVLPVYFVGWQAWLVGYLLVNMTMGLTLSIVFQLAHVVEKTSFEIAEDKPKTLDTEWAVHEIKTTANFATRNSIITWFVGGLNYQVEHHLFPRVSHIHYPALSRIVQEECKRFNLPYHAYPTMAQAVASHVRVIDKMLVAVCILQQHQLKTDLSEKEIGWRGRAGNNTKLFIKRLFCHQKIKPGYFAPGLT